MYLSSPDCVWVMVQASEAGKPALSGVVKELENRFEDRFDFHNPTNRRMIGSMIKEIIYDFGFRRTSQRLVSNSSYFSTASVYKLEEEKVEKTVSGLFKVQEEGKSETEPEGVAKQRIETEKTTVESSKSSSSAAFAEPADHMDQTLDKLLKILKDENSDRDSKRRAIKKLGKIGEAALSGVPYIRWALDDQILAKAAVDALTQIARSANRNGGISDVIFQFILMLRHHNKEQRVMAAESLGDIGAPGATEATAALVETLKDEEAEVRKKAAWALYKIGHPAFKTASSALAEALEDEDEDVRLEAARALGVCVPTSVDLLVELLEHKNPCVCRIAAVELGRAGEYARVDAAQGLIKALGSADTELKAAAAWALGSIGETTEGTVEALAIAGKEDTAHVREKAVWALGRIGAKLDYFNSMLLLKALRDENKNVRKAAAWALGNIQQKSHSQNPTARLMEMLHDESKEVQEKAVWALGKLGARSSMAKPCVPLLIEALSDEAWTLRKAAAQALGRIDSYATQALPKLADIQENQEEREIVRDMAAWAIDEISKYSSKEGG